MQLLTVSSAAILTNNISLYVGIWVSNHGARQLDTTPATIEVLGEICRAVAGRVEVYLDGGITRGTDVLKVSLKLRYQINRQTNRCSN